MLCPIMGILRFFDMRWEVPLNDDVFIGIKSEKQKIILFLEAFHMLQSWSTALDLVRPG